MKRVSVSIRTVAVVVLATSLAHADESGPAVAARRFKQEAFKSPQAANAPEPDLLAMYNEEEGTTTTTVTESGTSGGRTFSRRITISRSRSSGKGRSSSSSAKKKSRLKPGDEVLTEHGGDIFTAKVKGIDRFSGWIEVRFKDDLGEQIDQKLPADHFIPAVRRGKKLLTSGPGLKGEFEVGDEVLAIFGGVHIAEVVEISGTGWLKVKYDNDGFEMTPTLPPNKLRLIESDQVQIPLAEAAATRTWSSQGGKFTVEAKFVALRGDSVTLEKANGKTLTVELEKLSDDDQQLARQLAEALDRKPVRNVSEKD